MAITSIPFQPARKRSLGFEVLKLSELRARLARNNSDEAFEAPLRLDFHLLYIGTRGSGELLVDFEPAPLGRDWLTVVTRGRVHQHVARSRHVDAWMLLFVPELIASGPYDPLVTSALLSSRSGPSFPVAAGVRRDLRALCALLTAEYARPLDDVQPALVGALLRTVLLRAERDARRSSEATPPELVRFFAALERDVFTTRAVAHYARAAGMSARRLGERLALHVGRTAKQVIDERVVLETKRHLAHTDVTIKELAARAGFTEATNFVKFFRLHTGETPTAFRARFHHRSTGSHLAGSDRRR